MFSSRNVDWSKQPLGEMPDVTLAAKLGCGWRTIYRQRHRRNIPAWQPHRVPEIPIDVLGTMTDSAVAQLHGCTRQQVYRLRRKLEIPPFVKRVGGPTKPIPKALLKQLGKRSDTDIGKEFGLHFSQVYYYRVQRNIPAFNEKVRSRYLRRDEAGVLIGLRLAPDKIVGEVLGLSPSRVAEVRRELGIKSFSQREFCPCGKRAQSMGGFCSYECQLAVTNARGCCGIRIPSRSTRHHKELDGVLWALGRFNKTWCRLTGGTNRFHKRKASHGNETKTKAKPNRASSAKGRQLKPRARRKVA